MITLNKLYHSNWLLFIAAGALFAFGVYIHNVNDVILHMLEFTVIFELVRAFNHYLKDGTLRVRYGLDAAIFFSIKELYIGFVEFKIDTDYMLIIISLVTLSVLMVARYFNSTLVEEKRKLCNVVGCDVH